MKKIVVFVSKENGSYSIAIDGVTKEINLTHSEVKIAVRWILFAFESAGLQTDLDANDEYYLD